VKKAQDAKDLAANEARQRKLAAEIAAAQKIIDAKIAKDKHDQRIEKFVVDPECKNNALSKKCLPK